MNEYIVELTKSVTVMADSEGEALNKASLAFESGMTSQEMTVDKLS